MTEEKTSKAFMHAANKSCLGLVASCDVVSSVERGREGGKKPTTKTNNVDEHQRQAESYFVHNNLFFFSVRLLLNWNAWTVSWSGGPLISQQTGRAASLSQA